MVTESLIKDQFALATVTYPKLNVPTFVEGRWQIDGSLDVVDDEGFLWDTYDVRIIVPNNYPVELFELYEIGGKIERSADWHNHSSCCLSTNAIMFATLGENLTLANWLTKFALPYLANHIYRLETGDYAAGEFAHYTDGIVQGYEKLLGLSGKKAVVLKLRTICSLLRRERNDKCFCGSGKKFKKCFLQHPNEHKYAGVPLPLIEKDLREILGHLLAKAKS